MELDVNLIYNKYNTYKNCYELDLINLFKIPDNININNF